MRRTAFFCSLFWVLFGLVTSMEAYKLKLGTVLKPGSGFFPFSAGVVLLALGLTALVQSARQQGGTGRRTRREPIRWWNIVIVLLATVAYGLSLETVGFVVCTFLFVCLVLRVVEPKPWKTVLFAGLVTAFAAEVVFNVIFKAQIPTGIFGL